MLRQLKRLTSIASKAHNIANQSRNTQRSRTVESLEARVLLSAILVNTADDGFPSGRISLRSAIRSANNSSDATTITFDPTIFSQPQTITLNGNALEITSSSVSIIGPAQGLTLDGNNQSAGILVDAGAAVTVSGIKLTQCNGGAINNAGTLTLSESTISNSSMTQLLFNNNGGGLYNSGSAALTDVTISGNVAADSGGGIYNSGTISLSSVSISDNTASAGGGGGMNNVGNASFQNVTISDNSTSLSGGGFLNTGTADLLDMTISGNSASNEAGGVYSAGFATIHMTNTTVFGNSTFGVGGGIDMFGGGTMLLSNITVSGNSASSGGGIYVEPMGSPASIQNSIVAGNTADDSPDVFGAFDSQGFNLVGKDDGSTGWNRNGPDIVGSVSVPLDPKLSNFGDSGGTLGTLLPLLGSPAINAGSNSLVPDGISTDERGNPRIRDGTVDIGAVEVQSGTTGGLKSTTISVNASQVSVAAGAPESFTAVISAPAGDVADNGNTLGTADVRSDGTAVFSTTSMPVGANTITASYGGSSDYAASNSVPINVVVTASVGSGGNSAAASSLSVDVENSVSGLADGSVNVLSSQPFVAAVTVNNLSGLWLGITANDSAGNDRIAPPGGVAGFLAGQGVIPSGGSATYAVTFSNPGELASFSMNITNLNAFTANVMNIVISGLGGSLTPDNLLAVVTDVEHLSGFQIAAGRLKKVPTSARARAKLAITMVNDLRKFVSDKKQAAVVGAALKKVGIAVTQKTLKKVLTLGTIKDLLKTVASEIVLMVQTGGSDIVEQFVSRRNP